MGDYHEQFPCLGCGKTWTGYRRCHCATCHESFSSASAFDLHRKAFRCLPLPAVKRLELVGGYWQKVGDMGLGAVFTRKGAAEGGGLGG